MTPALFPTPKAWLLALAGGTALATVLAPVTPYTPLELRPFAMALSGGWALLRTFQLHRALLPWWAWRHGDTWLLNPWTQPAEGLLLGRGFRWTQQHTQRLEEALLEAGGLPLDQGDKGGHPCLHVVGKPQEQLLRLPWREGRRHIQITGSPGSGKTKALAVIETEVIRQPGAVIILDPKGSDAMLAQVVQAATHAGKPWALVSLAFPDQSATINVLDTASSPTEVAERIRVMFPGAGTSKEAIFDEYPLTVIEHVAAVQQALGIPWTLQGLSRDATHHGPMRRLLLAYLQHLGITPAKPQQQHDLDAHIKAYERSGLEDLDAEALIGDAQHDPDHFRKVTLNLAPAFRGVVGESRGRLLSTLPADLTWHRIVQEELVVYVSLASMLLGELSNRVGRVIIQDLVGYLGWRYAHRDPHHTTPITVIVDELRQVLYPHFNTALAMAREAECAWVLAQQSHADAEAVLGPAQARVLRDNCKTKLYFQLADHQTAEEASAGFGTCTVALPDKPRVGTHYGDMGGLSGNSDLTRPSRVVPLVRPAWLLALPVGEFYAQLEGVPYKGQVPLLLPPTPDLGPQIALTGQRPQLPAPQEGSSTVPARRAQAFQPWD